MNNQKLIDAIVKDLASGLVQETSNSGNGYTNGTSFELGGVEFGFRYEDGDKLHHPTGSSGAMRGYSVKHLLAAHGMEVKTSVKRTRTRYYATHDVSYYWIPSCESALINCAKDLLRWSELTFLAFEKGLERFDVNEGIALALAPGYRAGPGEFFHEEVEKLGFQEHQKAYPTFAHVQFYQDRDFIVAGKLIRANCAHSAAEIYSKMKHNGGEHKYEEVKVEDLYLAAVCKDPKVIYKNYGI